jgi:hypothetical protein
MVAHVHPKAKKYYEDVHYYFNNQKALEEGRLKDIAGGAAINDNIYKDDASCAYLVAAAEAARAAWDAEAEWSIWAAVAAERAATVAAVLEAAVDDVDDLIDIYFDGLEEA